MLNYLYTNTTNHSVTLTAPNNSTLTIPARLAIIATDEFKANELPAGVIATETPTNYATILKTLEVVNYISTVDTIDELKQLVNRVPTIVVFGRLDAADGLGGIFRWIQGDTTTADDISVVAPNEGVTGRWHLMFPFNQTFISNMLSYASTANMNADTGRPTNTTCWNLQDDNYYRWTGSTWSLIGPSIQSRLTILEAAEVTGLEDTMNVWIRTFKNYMSDAAANTAINTSGATTSNSGKYTTGFIKIDRNMKITRFGSAVASGTIVPYAFYDANKTFISAAYTTGSNSVDVYDLASAPVGAIYMRLSSATNSTIEYYIYKPKMLEFIRDMMFSLFGTPIDVSGQLTNQYINKGTGAEANSSSFRLTQLIPVTANSYICTGGGVLSSSLSSQAQWAFYNSSMTYLGYYNGIAPYQTIKVSDVYPTAAYVRATMRDTEIGPTYVIKANDTYDRSIDMLSTAAIVNWWDADLVAPGRLDTNGTITQPTSTIWRVTDFIPVEAGQVFYVTATDVTGAGPTVAAFDANKIYLGALIGGAGQNPILKTVVTNNDLTDYRMPIPATVLVGLVNVPIAYIRASYRNDTAPNTLLSGRSAQSTRQTASSTELSYLAPSAAYGRVTWTGTVTMTIANPGVVTWSKHGLPNGYPVMFSSSGSLPTGVTSGTIYYVSSNSKTTDTFTLAPTVSDALAGTNTIVTTGSQSGTHTIKQVANESVYMFTAGIMADRSVPVAWAPTPAQFSDFQGVEKLRVGQDIVRTYTTLAAMNADTTQPDNAVATCLEDDKDYRSVSGVWSVKHASRTNNVKLRASTGKVKVNIADFPVRLIDDRVAISPAVHMNIVCIGDSTTSQLSSDPNLTDGDGTWVNEMSRQLTGVGDQALTISNTVGSSDYGTEWGPIVQADIRPPLSLTNIHFRGTRGTGTIKHEGRGGWHPGDYLTKDVSGDGKVNAFWDPLLTPWGTINSQFSMKYFIEHNNWHKAVLSSGVETDGSNLLVIMALGWNDYGDNTNAGTSSGDIALLLNQIHAEYPQAKVWVPSLWAPLGAVFKANTGSVERWYSATEIFDGAVRAFGEAYRNVCLERPTYAEFVQVSHQMDPDYCFSKTTLAPNKMANDSTLAMVGAGDNVHMRRRGYTMLASIMADKFLWDYCQPA